MLSDLTEKLDSTNLVDVLSIVILLVVQHFKSKNSEHEELLFWIPLCIITRWCHRNIWCTHQFLLQLLRLVLNMLQIRIRLLLLHIICIAWIPDTVISFIIYLNGQTSRSRRHRPLEALALGYRALSVLISGCVFSLKSISLKFLP